MGAFRKSTYSARRPDFRRQLQRALSLSSFETEDTQSVSKLSAGNTTEDQRSIHSENDGSSVQSGSVGRNHEAQIDPALFSTARDVEKIEGQRDLPEDRDMIALECVAENVESSMNNQESLNEVVRSDLANILSRLAIMEEKISKADPDERHASSENRQTERRRFSRR
ncbi:uncharacterized protein N7473_001571 [Penicillium subrubescens]|uniref:Uncharacterized protein n=1 Tax=Penicillium subrubescens TaxID=1316194 RepID=A0A1Q5SYY1_9EURO|nr:uncharacterized protein N7473_001571 [Penicillium subrubescens]KAJ5904655.1 hypothetical protein N7473_001571 [Penicillium subrubescens]OKO93075.1 hypothetical protein PENSUB_12530 [Penicillium subrubescens]